MCQNVLPSTRYAQPSSRRYDDQVQLLEQTEIRWKPNPPELVSCLNSKENPILMQEDLIDWP